MAASVAAMMTAIAEIVTVTVEIVIVEVAIANMFTPNHAINLVYMWN